MSEQNTSKQNLWRMICDSATHEKVGAYLEDGTDYEGPTEPIDARCHAWHPDLVDYQRVTEPLLTRVEAANDEQVQRMVWDHIRDTQGLSDLLTREEAANDPEVINRVKQKLGYPKQWLEVTDDDFG